jgi:hypothetical protein
MACGIKCTRKPRGSAYLLPQFSLTLLFFYALRQTFEECNHYEICTPLFELSTAGGVTQSVGDCFVGMPWVARDNGYELQGPGSPDFHMLSFMTALAITSYDAQIQGFT